MHRAHVLETGFVVGETYFLFLSHVVSGNLYGNSQLVVPKEINTLRLNELFNPITTAKRFNDFKLVEYNDCTSLGIKSWSYRSWLSFIILPHRLKKRAHWW